jgi:hypothetical protein
MTWLQNSVKFLAAFPAAYLEVLSARSFDRIDDLFYTYLSRIPRNVEKRANAGREDRHQISFGPAQEFEVIYARCGDPTTGHS